MNIFTLCIDQETNKFLAFFPLNGSVVKAYSYTSSDEAVGRLVRENFIIFGERIIDVENEPENRPIPPKDLVK